MEEILIAQQFDVGEEKDNGHIWYRSYIVKELFLIINPSWITSLGTISTIYILFAVINDNSSCGGKLARGWVTESSCSFCGDV